MGCFWKEPANYDKGVFEDCEGTEGHYPGIYGTSTFYQGQKHTPRPHLPGSSSNCKKYVTVGNIPASVVPAQSKATPSASRKANKKADAMLPLVEAL